MKIIAVVPAYNESQTISQVVRDLKNEVNQVIVVDDGSADATAELAKNEGAVVLQHFLNRGQGAALQTGIEHALLEDADIIITFDSDGQHDAADIKKLIAPLLLGENDVVLGSRFIKMQNAQPKADPMPEAGAAPRAEKFKMQNLGMPFLKPFFLKMALWFDRLRTGLNISDTHNGLRAFSRVAAAKIKITQDGMAHASEILDQISQLKLKYLEVPVQIKYTEYSKQKGQRLSNSWKIIWDLLVSRILK